MATSIEDKVGIVQGRHCRAHHPVDNLGIHCHRNGQGWWELYPTGLNTKGKSSDADGDNSSLLLLSFFCAVFFFFFFSLSREPVRREWRLTPKELSASIAGLK